MPRGLQLVLGAVLALLLLAGGLLWWRQSLPLPEASLEAPGPLGRKPATLVLALSAPAGRLRSAELRIVQGGAEKLTQSADFAGMDLASTEWRVDVDPVAAGLAEGGAEVIVSVTDDQWRPKPDASPRLTTSLQVDLTPPAVEFLSATRYIKHAGTGVAVYRAKDAARSGVRAGGREFPGMSGLHADPDVRVALYTIPYDQPPAEPAIFAADLAGNERTIGAPVNFLPAEFSRDRFELKPEFMAAKVAELTPSGDTSTPEATLASYLSINREMRARNEASIREAASRASEPRPLWSGAFSQQPNSKVFAYFPQERDSLVKGEVVDTQWHLGLDLASTERSPILATNAGKVIFAGDNGIYGNTVILDHGLGLTSLYSHLSSMSASVGQSVAKGEAVGISGKSGLAGGDHLHYAMLVHGTYTNPIDWFDAGYLHDRIALPLVEAGISAPGLTDLAAPSRPKPSAKKAARSEGRRRR